MLAIKNGKLIIGNEIKKENIYIENEKIVDITVSELPCDEVIDAMGNYVAPGFIDIHTHGAGGSDFLDGIADAYLTAANVHAQHGATSIVPTITSVDTDSIQNTLTVFKAAYKQNKIGANLLGLHLEGPYFAPSQKGAQEDRFIRPFEKREYEQIIACADNTILRWSAAPELPGAAEFAKTLMSNNILPCIGHSDADSECVHEAFFHGFTHITHLYSCTSTVHRKNAFRYAGIVEAAYLNDAITVEIIADGIHLPPDLLKLVYKIKGPDKIALITDSMRGAGMPEGESVLGSKKNGLKVIIEDGVAKLPDRSAFAGSVATCDRLVWNMINLADVDICDTVKMITSTPAKILGLEKKGQLKQSYDADIVIFDNDIHVIMTIIGGKVVYCLNG